MHVNHLIKINHIYIWIALFIYLVAPSGNFEILLKTSKRSTLKRKAPFGQNLLASCIDGSRSRKYSSVARQIIAPTSDKSSYICKLFYNSHLIWTRATSSTWYSYCKNEARQFWSSTCRISILIHKFPVKLLFYPFTCNFYVHMTGLWY